jgi:hypothetical protein
MMRQSPCPGGIYGNPGGGDMDQDDFAGVDHGEVREIRLHPKDTFGMYLMLSQYDDSDI